MAARRCLSATGIVLAWLAAASGCIAHRPHRTFDYQDPQGHLPASCGDITLGAGVCEGKVDKNADGRFCTSVAQLIAPGPAGDAARATASCYAYERHNPVSDARFPHAGFDLHIVEFDDEGQPWNAKQVDQTLERLRKQLETPALVTLFVHGWKNDASVCNDNLACFREVLDVLSKTETLLSTTRGNHEVRRVIGVYVGWRGGSLRKPADALTFWGRKHTAHTIGDNGAVTALIARLRQIVDMSTPRRAQRKDAAGVNEPNASSAPATTMVMVGHSFGAALLFSALGTSLNADAATAIQDSVVTPDETAASAALRAAAGPNQQTATPEPAKRDTSTSQALSGGKPTKVPSRGDLVVLLNPAMEASRFANLAQASLLRYKPEQAPIFLTLGSEGDFPVKYIFPIGQSFSTILRSARSREAWFSTLEGFGMYHPYHTHRLSLARAGGAEVVSEPRSPFECSSQLRRHGDALIERLRPYYKALDSPLPAAPDKRAADVTAARSAEVADTQSAGAFALAGYQEFLYSRLEPLRDVDPNLPFMMVSVDRQVVGGHSDIFNPTFTDFLIEFTARSELKRAWTERGRSSETKAEAAEAPANAGGKP